MKAGKLLILTVASFFATQCSHRQCYEIKIQLPDQKISDHFPVFIDRGIIGYIDTFRKDKGIAEGSICIPDGVKISKDSKILIGFIRQLGVEGIEMIPGNQLDFFGSGDVLRCVRIDSISIDSSGLDSLVSNKLKEIVRDIQDKR